MVSFSGKVLIKKIIDLGNPINMESSIAHLRDHSRITLENDYTLAMVFDWHENPFSEQFPIRLHFNNAKNEVYFRLYTSGVLVITVIMDVIELDLTDVKKELLGKLRVFDENKTIKAMLNSLRDLLVFQKDLSSLRKQTVSSIGVFTVFISDPLFDDVTEFLNNNGYELFANVFVKSPVTIDMLSFDMNHTKLLTRIESRYKDELLLLGRHSFFIHAPTRGEKFINNLELVYEMARVHRFLIRLYGRVLHDYNKYLSRVISKRHLNTYELGRLIIEINLLRKELVTTLPETYSYPTLITNIYFVMVYEETIRIGYGDKELSRIEKSLEQLDAISNNIFNIRNVMNDELINSELRQLNMIFIIGVTAQLLSFLTLQVSVFLSSSFFIIASVIFGFLIYFSVTLLTKKKFKKFSWF